MGSYVFTWPYPADDVHVTGTFDDWAKSEQLIKVGDIWEKEVQLPSADEKVLYKFVVDDEWIVDERAPKAGDGHNNVNNVLLPEHIKRREITANAPGAFPETPSAEQTFSINPIPASSGIGNPIHLKPGEPIPSGINTNTIESTVTTSREDYEKTGAEQTFSVNPIPASSGIGNPIHLKPGEPIPSGINTNTVDSTVTTSKEDYEKGGALAVGAIAAGAAGVAAGTAFKKPEGGKNIIPESSLPMGGEKLNTLDAGPFISSTAPGTSASDLAAKVPLEKNTAGATPLISSAAPGTSTSDLAAKIPLEKNTSNASPFISSAAPGTTTSDLAAQVPLEKGSAGASPFISSAAPGTTTSDLAAKVPLENNSANATPLISSAAAGSTTAALAGGVALEQKRQAMVIDPKDATTTSVPETVQQSIGQARTDPEAAASAEAVREKTDMEKELLSKVHPTEAKGEPASAAAGQSSYHGLATSVPQPVEDSMAKAQAAPEAAADSSVVAEKTALEKELLKKVPSTDAAGEPAPTIAAATSSTAPTSTTIVATSLTDGQTANQAIPDTDTSTAHRGLSAGEVAAGAAAGTVAGASATAAAKQHSDVDAQPATVADSNKPDITTERSPVETKAIATSTTPSEMVPDSSLADEPAVKLMNQNEAPSSSVKKAVGPPGPTEDGTAGASIVAAGVPTVTDVGTGTPKVDTKNVAAPTSTPSTPSKKAPESAVPASPASTAATDKSKKKHRHRLSTYLKKVFN